VKISRQLLDEMIEHAQVEAPNECCGMIATEDGHATKVYRATNLAASPLKYEIDPLDQMRIQDDIDDNGWDLTVIYHSHTRSEPYPSQTDINLALPGVLYTIIGLAAKEPVVRTFKIGAGRVEEVPLDVA